MNSFSILAATVLLFQAGTQAADPKLSAQLLPGRDSIAPGQTIPLVVALEIEKPWHMYHPILLGPGLPTQVGFDAPAGVSVAPVRFPTPTLGTSLGSEYLGFGDRFHLLTAVTLPQDYSGQSLELTARINGLACIDEKCRIVKASAPLTLPVAKTADATTPANAAALAKAQKALPPLIGEADVLKGSSLRVEPSTVKLEEKAAIVLDLKIKPRIHIQAPGQEVEGLIGARLFIEPVDGIAFDEPVWPPPHEREIEYVGRVREYSGNIEVRIPFVVGDASFGAGPVTVRLLLQYQACTEDGSCFPPVLAEEFAHFEVDTENPAGNRVESDYRRGPTPIEPVEAAAQAGADTSGTQRPSDFPPTPVLTAEDWADHIPWQKWVPGWAEELSRQGHMVYVDYTADWCLTCQTNKLVLETEPVRRKMAELHVIPIKADFTNFDERMLKELKRFGRAGVPTNVIYPAGKPEGPALLPELLTQGTVLRALEHPEEFSIRKESQLFAWVLLLGFVGGFILNFMPCVLPVISIKVLSFVQQAGEDRGRILKLGLAFCAGIMVWFWIFAFIAASGELPLQSPRVVIALGSIMFVFALNLFGVFEIVLPGAAAGRLDQAASKEGYSGAFMKGLLATLLGTACTAPFLGFALGYAVTQPRWVSFAIFTAAGLGMAFPYLLLSAKPAWMRFLPRPGMWMVTFKQAMGFILVGSAVWLLWILGRQRGADAVVWTIAFWCFLGLASWLLGKSRPNWNTGPRLAIWTAAVGVAAFGWWLSYQQMNSLGAP